MICQACLYNDKGSYANSFKGFEEVLFIIGEDKVQPIIKDNIVKLYICPKCGALIIN